MFIAAQAIEKKRDAPEGPAHAFIAAQAIEKVWEWLSPAICLVHRRTGD